MAWVSTWRLRARAARPAAAAALLGRQRHGVGEAGIDDEELERIGIGEREPDHPAPTLVGQPTDAVASVPANVAPLLRKVRRPIIIFSI